MNKYNGANAYDLCAVLVVSCDAYSDLWPPFFNLLNAHWPDCPFPLYLGAGRMKHSNVCTLNSEGGRDWSRCMLDYINQIPNEYIILMLDDFFLRKKVDNQNIYKALEFAITHNAHQVRLVPRPKPIKKIMGCNLFGICPVGQPYRISTQAAIWRKNSLREFLREGESIWEFEINANERSHSYLDGFYSSWYPLIPYIGLITHHVVEKGKWLIHEKYIFSIRRVGCDFSKRDTLPFSQNLFYMLVVFLDQCLDVFPWRVEISIKKYLKMMFSPLFQKSLYKLRKLN